MDREAANAKIIEKGVVPRENSEVATDIAIGARPYHTLVIDSDDLELAQALEVLGAVVVMRPKVGERGSYMSVLASTEQLLAFNTLYRMAEDMRFRGARTQDHPDWAKRDGAPDHVFWGV